MTRLVVWLLLATTAGALIGAEPTRKRNDAKTPIALPLDLTRPVTALVAERQHFGHVLYSKEPAVLVDSQALWFHASVDDRPFVYESCLFWARVRINDNDRWWLVVFFRRPYGPPHHQRWRLRFRDDLHSPVIFRQFSEPPTNEDVLDFLKWANWEFSPRKDFKFIVNRVFRENWKQVIGDEPPREGK